MGLKQGTDIGEDCEGASAGCVSVYRQCPTETRAWIKQESCECCWGRLVASMPQLMASLNSHAVRCVTAAIPSPNLAQPCDWLWSVAPVLSFSPLLSLSFSPPGFCNRSEPAPACWKMGDHMERSPAAQQWTGHTSGQPAISHTCWGSQPRWYELSPWCLTFWAVTNASYFNHWLLEWFQFCSDC